MRVMLSIGSHARPTVSALSDKPGFIWRSVLPQLAPLIDETAVTQPPLHR